MRTAGDTSLLEQWRKRRDAAAFNELVARYAGMVYSTCRRILGNDRDAEDITQECFLELAESSGRVRTSLGGWLHRVAANRSLNLLKSDSRRRVRESPFVKDGIEHADPVWQDIEHLVDEAIESLPEKFRSVIVGNFLDHQTHAEMAPRYTSPNSHISR